jgi:hypothetical protein
LNWLGMIFSWYQLKNNGAIVTLWFSTICG